ncbi:MAG TPA: VanZ family protein [Nakamurella sp.]|jgi:glycopeptide antibiotics resistance protein|nr:VanZ family protein [Nakamurella sp.]
MHRAPEARPQQRGLRWASAGFLVAFVLVIAVITFSPAPPDHGGQIALARFIILGHRRDGLPLWITFGRVEFAANVVMLVPIGFFGALSLTRARWLIVPAAIAASAVIEVSQALALPARDGSPRDVISNSLGALLGYLFACAYLRWVGRREWLRTIPLARDAGPARAMSGPARRQV